MQEVPRMLADEADYVIGVDTHRDTHTAAIVSPATGAVEGHRTEIASSLGYKRILAFACGEAPGRRAWAIEGTGSFGAGLTTYLLERGERVVEVDRPKRPARRSGAKSDELDAIRAAREALSREHPSEPRRRGEREAIRVLLRTREGAMRARSVAICHVKALVVTAPEGLRSALTRLSDLELVGRCARLCTGPAQSIEHRATVSALRASARRALTLEAEANDLESQLELLVEQTCPALLDELGVGTMTAAELINAWSHPGRLRSDAAFASLGGAAPIPASSGLVVRHRLNRGGDRQLNRALHTIALTRLTHCPETRAYAARRLAEGKTAREVKRCLKRYLARRMFRLLETAATSA
jgi:transposase